MNENMSQESRSNIDNIYLRQKIDTLNERIHLYEKEQEQLHASDFDIVAVWHKIWSRKLLISVFLCVFAITSTLFSLSISDQYESHTLVAPTSEDNKGSNLAKLAGQFSGLTSMVGLDFGGNADKITLAVATLKSRKFSLEFIKRHELLIPLMAGMDWDEATGNLVLDEDIYNSKTGEWVRDVTYPITPEPMDFEIYEAFQNIFTIYENKKSGYYKLSLEFYSPVLAKKWLEWLVQDINTEFKKFDIDESRKNIAFMENKLSETKLYEMKSALNKLIESQTRTMMLASIRGEYIFKTVDPAFLPEEKSYPVRWLIIIMSTFFGGCLSLLIIFFPWNTKRNPLTKDIKRSN